MQKYKNFCVRTSIFSLTFQRFNSLTFLVALEHTLHIGRRQLLGEEAYQQHYWESSQHGNGTAIDGIDGVTQQHIHHGSRDPA